VKEQADDEVTPGAGLPFPAPSTNILSVLSRPIPSRPPGGGTCEVIDLSDSD
jgi:hypothetical protein